MLNNARLMRVTGILACKDADRKRVLTVALKAAGSYQLLAGLLGVNQSYLHNYIKRGLIPPSRMIQGKMGIKDRNLEVTRSRYAKSQEIAKEKGYESWSQFQTMVNKGDVEIPSKE